MGFLSHSPFPYALRVDPDPRLEPGRCSVYSAEHVILMCNLTLFSTASPKFAPQPHKRAVTPVGAVVRRCASSLRLLNIFIPFLILRLYFSLYSLCLLCRCSLSPHHSHTHNGSTVTDVFCFVFFYVHSIEAAALLDKIPIWAGTAFLGPGSARGPTGHGFRVALCIHPSTSHSFKCRRALSPVKNFSASFPL